jgi:hypothetical protein
VAGTRAVRLVSAGWNQKNGEHARISLPKSADVGDIISIFYHRVRTAPKGNLPKFLRQFAYTHSSEGPRNRILTFGFDMQDTRAEKFMEDTTKSILTMCRGRLPRQAKEIIK